MANTYNSTRYQQQMENGARQQSENKMGWKYHSCECCPYGYHIDLDFVRYCDSLKERVDYTGSINKRRERRRQRQSMEVLLGLAPTPTPTFSTFPRTAEHCSAPPPGNHINIADISNSSARSALLQDALGEVVTDFERTLERSNGSASANNTFDSAVEILQRASSNSSVSSGSGCGSWLETSATTSAFIPNTNTTFAKPPAVNGLIGELDSSKCSNADTLKNIRKQMALGLERMRELEDQVKLIPALQVQVSVLKDEKRKLLEQIREQSVTVNELNTKVLAETMQKFAVASRRDAAVMCSTITRTIGVGPQYPKTRNIATETIPCGITSPKAKPDSTTKSRSSQTKRPIIEETAVQTVEYVKHVQNCGVNVKPETVDFALQIGSQLRTIGVSNDSIMDNVCNKCNILTRTIGVGPGTGADSLMPISLKSLSVPRSKSFNLGEEKLGHNSNSRYRTVGCQSEKFCMNRACQYEPKVSSRACQYEPMRKTVNKSIQSESVSVTTQSTETVDLKPSSKDAICNTISPQMANASINTVRSVFTDTSSNTRSPILTETSSNTDPVQCYDDGTKKEEITPVSRIPRTSIPVPVSSERHKLRRQDTYTKIPAVVVNSGLSGIELSPTTPTQTADTVEPESTNNLSLAPLSPKASKSISSPVKPSETNDYPSENKDEQISLPVSDSAFFNQIDRSSRTKALPSKEMQAAMKVLNDSLQKSKLTGGNMTNTAKSHLKNALSIIQQEWFKISSLVSADPLNVEDYLDRFEEISGVLLQYIVNMTDDSGNTAMHYAVSHGNFDVVSILLDSKVCNINKPNKAGYTSVMLVSLTEVRSPTDATVVKRLFQLADVNVRAKQHGQTALMLAVSHGRLDMVQMLLECGADINIQDEDGSTALMCAAEHGHIEIVKYFLGHPECDSSILDVDGSTALKIALEAGYKDIGVLLYAHEHSVHGISPYSSLKQRKSKNPSNVSSTAVSRSPSRGALSNKSAK